MPEYLFANIGASITLALGVLGLLRPHVAANLVGITPVGKTGLSEIRATYGGIFLGLGAGLLYFQDPNVFSLAAFGWWGAGAARLASAIVDGSWEGKNIGAIAMEATVGGLFVI